MPYDPLFADAWYEIPGPGELRQEIQQVYEHLSDLDAATVEGPDSSIDGNLVMWSGVEGATVADSGYAASDFAEAVHTHDDRYYTESEVDTALSGKSDTSHTHDDRYYTETEVDTAISGVVTYGSNANGSYLRFPDLGIQICWHDLSTVHTTSTASGNVYVSSGETWTYPQAFSSAPLIVPAARYGGSGGAAWGRVNATPTTTTVSCATVGSTNTSTGILTPVAIGTYTP